MFLDISLQDWWLIVQIVGYLLGTGILGTVVNWCYKTYVRVSKTLSFVELLEKELKPNGGSSMRDAINRIEAQINYIKFAQHTYWDHWTNVAMFSSDSQGRCIWANKTLCELLGKQVTDFLGTAWEIMVHQDERDDVREAWNRAISEQTPFDMSYTMVSHNGRSVKVRCKAFGSTKTGYIGFIVPLHKSQV